MSVSYREGRLFEPDWWLRGYPPDTLLYQPKSMTADELLNGYARLNRQTYSFDAMLKRFFGISPWKRSLRGCLAYAGHQSILPHPLYQRPEEAPAIYRGCQPNRRALESF